MKRQNGSDSLTNAALEIRVSEPVFLDGEKRRFLFGFCSFGFRLSARMKQRRSGKSARERRGKMAGEKKRRYCPISHNCEMPKGTVLFLKTIRSRSDERASFRYHLHLSLASRWQSPHDPLIPDTVRPSTSAARWRIELFTLAEKEMFRFVLGIGARDGGNRTMLTAQRTRIPYFLLSFPFLLVFSLLLLI